MALSSAISNAGTKFYISPNLPADSTAAAFQAVTGWILVGEVTTLGTYGGKTTVISHIPIDTATVVKRSGSSNPGTLSITAARHTGADTTALQNAFKNRLSQSFKIVLPPALGVVDYSTGVVTGLQTSIANADSILEQMIEIELDSDLVTV